jgi:hypothetical protein
MPWRAEAGVPCSLNSTLSCTLSQMANSRPSSSSYEQALRLIARGKDRMTHKTMVRIARLMGQCNDAEKCLGHYLMDREVVADDSTLRFWWMLTKAGMLACLPKDNSLLRELYELRKRLGADSSGQRTGRGQLSKQGKVRRASSRRSWPT